MSYVRPVCPRAAPGFLRVNMPVHPEGAQSERQVGVERVGRVVRVPLADQVEQRRHACHGSKEQLLWAVARRKRVVGRRSGTDGGAGG